MNRRKFMECAALAAGGLSAEALAKPAKVKKTKAAAVPGGDRDKLLLEAKRIFALNLVSSSLGKFHLPSNSNYPRFYAWDSGWNVISQSAFDPEAAYQELLAIFNGLQVDSGYVAHEALVPEFQKAKDSTFQNLGNDYFDAQGRCRIIDPPSFLVAAEVLYNKSKDARILALLPKMQKCLDYLTGPRDLFGDGLVSIIDPWEAGTDLAPYFDQAFELNIRDPFSVVKVGAKFKKFITDAQQDGWDLQKIAARNAFVFEDLCMNSLTAAGAVSMSNLYLAAGQKDQADKCMAVAQKMVSAMESICWDDGKDFFFPRWDLKRKLIAKRVSVPGMLPLLTGLVSKDKAKKVIEKYLLSPDQFWGPWLVPFNSIKEMKSENTLFVRMELWRGPCIWINMNWMAARAAANYDRVDLAKKITKNTATMIQKSGFREYYSPDNGKGQGAVNFTWPALVLDMIDEYGMG
jgi:hypothetical protein